MAYQPGSFTSRGYTPGMSDEELRKRKAQNAITQKSLAPVNYGFQNAYEMGMRDIGSQLKQAPGNVAEATGVPSAWRGITEPQQQVGMAPAATSQQPIVKPSGYPNYSKMAGGTSVGGATLNGVQEARMNTPAFRAQPQQRPSVNVNQYLPASVAVTPSIRRTGNAEDDRLSAHMAVGDQVNSNRAAVDQAVRNIDLVRNTPFANTGTTAASAKAMQDRYAAFEAKTNANYQAMRDRMAQGKPGYTPPRVEREGSANRAAQVQMVQEREKGNAAEDARKQNAAMELGKQAGEYRLKEQELQNKGIVAASDVKAAAIMAGIDEKAANKLTPKDAAEVYNKLLETIDPNDTSAEGQAKRSLAEKMRLVLEGAAGAAAGQPPQQTAFKAGDVREKGGVKYRRDEKGNWNPI